MSLVGSVISGMVEGLHVPTKDMCTSWVIVKKLALHFVIQLLTWVIPRSFLDFNLYHVIVWKTNADLIHKPQTI